MNAITTLIIITILFLAISYISLYIMKYCSNKEDNAKTWAEKEHYACLAAIYWVTLFPMFVGILLVLLGILLEV